MSKITVALGSFIAGALSMFLMLSGSQTAAVAHASQAVSATTGSTIVSGPLPKVPPLGSRLPSCLISDSTLVVDGSNFDECVFKNATLVYGGGPLRFGKLAVSGTLQAKLEGAAANTVVFLNLLSALQANQQPQPATPKTPILRAAEVAKTMTVAFDTPY